MLIEDDYMVARAIVRILGQLGTTVVGPAGSVALATELAETADFDYALLDINLQGVQAYSVADILMRRRIPFAFLTGYDGLDIQEDYRNVPVLQKPFNLDDLKALWCWGR
jgi:CheY-like chemotaxis protein